MTGNTTIQNINSIKNSRQNSREGSNCLSNYNISDPMNNYRKLRIKEYKNNLNFNKQQMKKIFKKQLSQNIIKTVPNSNRESKLGQIGSHE